MIFYAKLVLSGINIACLIITLLYPNSGTPFSIIPIIVTASSWIFMTNRSDELTQKKTGLLVFATFLGAFCMTIGLTATIEPLEGYSSNYIVYIRDSVAILGGISFSYWTMAVIFTSVIVLMVADVAATKPERKGSFVITTFLSAVELAEKNQLHID